MNKPIDEIIFRYINSLARDAVKRQYLAERQIWKKYGSSGRQRAVEDARFHLLFLAEAVKAGEPILFREYISWLKLLFKGLGFPNNSLVSTINYTFDTVYEKLSEQQQKQIEIYQSEGLDAAAGTPKTSSFINEGNEAGQIAKKYLQLLLNRNQHEALKLITGAVENGFQISDIYLKVFQPVQREVGRLWQTGSISVAEEHYCSSATQMVMSQFYPAIFSTPKINRRLLAASVGGELHEIGIRMVTDLFALDGWDTYYMGANTPDNSIAYIAKDWRPDVIALSATMTFHLSHIAKLIKLIRKTVSKPPKIIVGGLPFNIAPNLWKKLEADGYAGDGRQAVIIARQLVKADVSQ